MTQTQRKQEVFSTGESPNRLRLQSNIVNYSSFPSPISFTRPPPTPPWLHDAQRACQLIRQLHLSEKKRKLHLKTILDFIDHYIHWVLTTHSGPGPLVGVLDCALEYGDTEDRADIAGSLKGWYAGMLQRREHKMLVLKILDLVPSARLSIFVELQRYGIVPLLLNYEAIGVLLEAFDAHADADERTVVVRGLLGRMACTIAELADARRAERGEKGKVHILSEVLRECRRPGEVSLILGAARSNLLTIFNNPNPSVASSTVVHRALLEYLQALDTLPDRQLADAFRGDVVQKCLQHMELLTFSPDGSRVVEEINVIIQRAEIASMHLGAVLPTPYATPSA